MNSTYELPPEQDPAMQEAIQHARRSWPKFEKAFRRRKRGQVFLVKAAFTGTSRLDGKARVERMWFQVSEINDGMVQGVLDNWPCVLSDVKKGDRVSVRVSEIWDWTYLKNGYPYGNYTIKVLRQRYGLDRA